MESWQLRDAYGLHAGQCDTRWRAHRDGAARRNEHLILGCPVRHLLSAADRVKCGRHESAVGGGDTDGALNDRHCIGEMDQTRFEGGSATSAMPPMSAMTPTTGGSSTPSRSSVAISIGPASTTASRSVQKIPPHPPRWHHAIDVPDATVDDRQDFERAESRARRESPFNGGL